MAADRPHAEGLVADDAAPLSVGIPQARDGGATTAQLVFATLGGSYLIDNVMVDPYRRR